MYGIPGFFVDEPRAVLLNIPSLELAQREVSRLFQRLVAPIPVVDAVRAGAPAKSRIRTVVTQVLASVDPAGERIARDVVIHDNRSDATFDLDFAYVNGSVTFGQTVDLTRAPSSHPQQIDHVVANIAQLDKRMPKLKWLNVVRSDGDDPDSAAVSERLRGWGRVIELPREQEFFVQLLQHDATKKITTAFPEKGLVIEQASIHGVELRLPPPGPPLEPTLIG
jgi:hypothetical protein